MLLGFGVFNLCLCDTCMAWFENVGECSQGKLGEQEQERRRTEGEEIQLFV